jgi:hypothetical protein
VWMRDGEPLPALHLSSSVLLRHTLSNSIPYQSHTGCWTRARALLLLSIHFVVQ